MLEKTENTIIVGLETGAEPQLIPLEESLAELARLTHTAGAKVVGTLSQKRPMPDQRYYIGQGKLLELQTLVKSTEADMVVFDISLSSSQQRNLEEFLGLKVIDRTELILDIFALHAKSREGKLQVELAQDSFLLSRLSGHGVSMSRLGGGIGTRGPGETKLEYDRRNIRKRISELKKEIKQLARERTVKREKRKTSHFHLVALVGYTNSGKSTLLNSLSNAGVLAQDKLFATLDPTVRRIYLPSKQTILLTDTVGFIQKLPHQLVAAFAATLEEVTEADLLLHIVDSSNPYFEDQINAVYTVLEELNCVTKPIITVFNKVDRLDEKIEPLLIEKYQPAISISALHKQGLEELQAEITRVFSRQRRQPA